MSSGPISFLMTLPGAMEVLPYFLRMASGLCSSRSRFSFRGRSGSSSELVSLASVRQVQRRNREHADGRVQLQWLLPAPGRPADLRARWEGQGSGFWREMLFQVRFLMSTCTAAA